MWLSLSEPELPSALTSESEPETSSGSETQRRALLSGYVIVDVKAGAENKVGNPLPSSKFQLARSGKFNTRLAEVPLESDTVAVAGAGKG